MKYLLTGASALALTTLLASQGFAQTATVQTDSSGAVEAVVVTGTRTSGLRAVDSPAPIQVLGADLLKRTGQPDLIQSLAQNIPSIQAQAFGGDQEEYTLSFKLRGLSPNDTLVLVNGQRRHTTANVAVGGGPFGGGASADISFIPQAGIDHVEVLQDGAAAQYGTDAIAGVVNIILKKNAQGGQISATAGQYYDQGGLTTDISGNYGIAPNDKSFLNITGEYKFHGNSFRGDYDPRVYAVSSIAGTPLGANRDKNGLTPSITTVPNAASAASTLAAYPLTTTFPGYPNTNQVRGDGQQMLYTGMFNAGYDITPDMQLYSYGTIGYKDGRGYENYRVGSQVLAPSGAPLYPAGFLPLENQRDTDYAFTIGLKGNVGSDTTYNVASNYGRDYERIYVLGSSNAAYYYDALKYPALAQMYGAPQQNFHDGDYTTTQWVNQVDLTHTLNVGLSEPITLAAGGVYRVESYQLKGGDYQSYYSYYSGNAIPGYVASGKAGGAQSFFGYGPTNAIYGQRINWAGYGDAALSPIKNLKLDAAVRYEDYSDFGGSTVGKVTARYDFIPEFALRGTVSTGFRAPTLAEEFYNGINVGPNSVSGIFAPNSAGAHFLGLNGLQPETSMNYSVGLVAHPIPRMTVTLDAYQIKVDNRIVMSGSFYGYQGTVTQPLSPSVTQALAAVGVPLTSNIQVPSGSESIQSFVNGADTLTRGVDLVATYPMDYGRWGHVDYSFTGAFNETSLTNVKAPPGNINPLVKLLDPAAISTLVNASPKYRFTAGAYWTLHQFSVNLRESFYGSAFELAADPLTAGLYDKIQVNATPITDLEIGYQLPKGVKIYLGANNLFNAYPNKENAYYRQGQLNTVSSGFSSSTYPDFSAFGINGGYYYGRVTLSF